MIQRRSTLTPPFPWSSVQRSPLQRRRCVRGCAPDFRLEQSGNRPRRGGSPRRCVARPRQSRRRDPARRQPIQVDPGRWPTRAHRERRGGDLLRPRRKRLVSSEPTRSGQCGTARCSRSRRPRARSRPGSTLSGSRRAARVHRRTATPRRTRSSSSSAGRERCTSTRRRRKSSSAASPKSILSGAAALRPSPPVRTSATRCGR
jgi:hypothetical protein